MQVWETNSQEAENKRKALLITILVNVLVLLAIYFIVVWKEQIPPLQKYGMELNLGFSDVGSGNRPTTAQPSDVQTTNTDAPAPGQQSPTPTEATVPIAQPKTEVAKPATKPTQQNLEAVSKTPSPVKGSDKPSPSTTKETTPARREPTPVTKPADADAKQTTTKAEEAPQVNQRALMGAGGSTGTSTQPVTGSAQGSSTTKGDEGRPQGTVDGRAIMGQGTGTGNTGPSSGIGLDLAGWEFASQPTIRDNVSTRNGRIVFRITVDDNGKIVQSVPLEYNVSNEVLAYYRTVLNQINFKRQSGNPTAEFSQGRITFIIKVD
ncbi:energy transducer TonB [Mongoliitalea daihaiensis]|uniref:energy transducer TonB n=1 Tax=Mongoliitalea daihaiensis TaxID=2782006 RepID=UPI001F40F26F|nr:energy transducer TonB [Mongoliitalea daihaiensis]UJP64280.1 energy transducer TonB [Mongoliitalea daihaiensis]